MTTPRTASTSPRSPATKSFMSSRCPAGRSSKAKMHPELVRSTLGWNNTRVTRLHRGMKVRIVRLPTRRKKRRSSWIHKQLRTKCRKS
ncbi:hypothetical protein RvY_11671 [Ramazzottius varieornatus]|uniref:Uncharacterized protein n=1 Tax=Ramazzottius varieornatus TaxID=947166 RepID=A0A1D1VL79_RAMVA|nr:hypothetical protein RvY_11671 [Ramazzottius varieornatus]